MIDYTDPDTIARQNIAPNAGCNIDGKFYDVRNLVHLASSQADRIEALTAKMARAEWLLTDAAVQLEEGKIKTRRNRAGLIWQFLDEIKGESHD